jgi:hypothetical protein
MDKLILCICVSKLFYILMIFVIWVGAPIFVCVWHFGAPFHLLYVCMCFVLCTCMCLNWASYLIRFDSDRIGSVRFGSIVVVQDYRRAEEKGGRVCALYILLSSPLHFHTTSFRFSFLPPILSSRQLLHWPGLFAPLGWGFSLKWLYFNRHQPDFVRLHVMKWFLPYPVCVAVDFYDYGDIFLEMCTKTNTTFFTC